MGHIFLFFLGGWFFCIQAGANSYTHNEPRLIIGSDAYPWRTLGKLTSCPSCKAGCTAFLVGEKHIVTNSHCVYEDADHKKLSSKDFYFIRNPIGDLYRAEAYTAKPVKNGYEVARVSDAYDWTIMELSANIGAEVGYMGFKQSDQLSTPGFRGTRSEIPPLLNKTADHYQQLCRETRFPFDDFKKFTESGPRDDTWYEHPFNIPNPALLCMSGFPGDVGSFNQVLSENCTFVGRDDEAYNHDCASSRGSSGSPIFYLDSEGLAMVVSVNRGGYRPDGESILNAPLNMGNSNVSTEIAVLVRELKNLLEVKVVSAPLL